MLMKLEALVGFMRDNTLQGDNVLENLETPWGDLKLVLHHTEPVGHSSPQLDLSLTLLPLPSCANQ